MAQPEDPRTDHDALDQRLRRALEPSPEVVDRVIRVALEDRSTERRRDLPWTLGWGRSAWVAVALLVLSGGLWLSSGFRDTGTGLEVGPPTATTPKPVFHMSNESGFVTVSTPHGTRWVVLPNDNNDAL